MSRFDEVSDRELLDLAVKESRDYQSRDIQRRPASVLAVRKRINLMFKRNYDRLSVARAFGYTTDAGLRAALDLIDLKFEQLPTCVTKDRAA